MAVKQKPPKFPITYIMSKRLLSTHPKTYIYIFIYKFLIHFYVTIYYIYYKMWKIKILKNNKNGLKLFYCFCLNQE